MPRNDGNDSAGILRRVGCRPPFFVFCFVFFVLLDVDWFRFDGIIDRIQILPADKKNDQKKGSMLSVMFLNK